MFSYTARLFLEIWVFTMWKKMVEWAISDSYTDVCIVATEEHEIRTISFYQFIQDKVQLTKYKYSWQQQEISCAYFNHSPNELPSTLHSMALYCTFWMVSKVYVKQGILCTKHFLHQTSHEHLSECIFYFKPVYIKFLMLYQIPHSGAQTCI